MQGSDVGKNNKSPILIKNYAMNSFNKHQGKHRFNKLIFVDIENESLRVKSIHNS